MSRAVQFFKPPVPADAEELGELAYCCKCRDWWPADDEFFQRRDGKYRSPCKACEAEKRRVARARKKTAA